MKGTSTKCDVCGVEKKESNKWWVGIESDFGVSLNAPDSLAAALREDPGYSYDFCGTGCALKWASQKLPEIQARFVRCEEAERGK